MSSEIVGILDYGAGNFGSVQRAIAALNVEAKAIRTAEELFHVSRLIFPGVGTAKQAMRELTTRNLAEPLKEFAKNGRPLLGICVGMQVLGEWSEEGDTECLGLLPFRVEKFRCKEPVPHMGWNSIVWNSSHDNFVCAQRNLSQDANFYFVHSYAAFVGKEMPTLPEFVLGETSYGGQNFAALVSRQNIWGAQCHIEKSGRVGLQFIENFLRWRNV
ncbi:imidazole glycerol phosphate synthase subunit HisH [bacterium]|nr:imidazole glycerol phosphate synthase subunit HisH [bacterium]